MKKWLSLILIVITLLAVIFFCIACYSPKNGGLLFTEVEGGYQVTGISLWNRLYKNFTVDIPSQYNGKPVVAISDGAFMGYTSLISVKIPDTVKKIGAQAFFGCVLLANVDIPDSVTHIGYGAFYGCRELTSINIPDSVTHIDTWTFLDCDSLTSINIPDSVTHIGTWAFDSCDYLTIYCEAKSKPAGWDGDWNSSLPVVWGYTPD